MSSFKSLLYSFLGVSLGLWLAFGFADWVHPRLDCFSVEREYWSDRADTFQFKRVSSFFWSALCAENAKPIVISASEGAGTLSFPEVIRPYGVMVHQFTGAHRGLKTMAFIAASKMSEERRRNLRALVFINPVYFGFAASTDSASIRRTSISNLSYILRIPSPVQKWDEFIFDSLFIGAKSYLDEVSFFKNPKPAEVEQNIVAVAPDDADFTSDRNMLKAKTKTYPAFSGPFSSSKQPARYLFDLLVEFANEYPEMRVCYVMLPTNTRNLRYFGRDADRIAKEMSGLMKKMPDEASLDLQSLNEENYIFLDPMHLTDFGKRRVIEEVMASPCGKRVFE